MRIRRGPATVIGDAGRRESHWREILAGKAAAGRPVSQETRPDLEAHTPSWKGVALMKQNKLLAGGGAMLVLALALGSTALGAVVRPSGPRVTVRVEGLSRTLLGTTTVRPHAGSLTRFGAPNGKCSDRSAAGRFQRRAALARLPAVLPGGSTDARG